jgi:hypothetical protein
MHLPAEVKDLSNSAAVSTSDSPVLDALFRSFAQGDVDQMRACFTPGAWIWHSFDCISLSVDQACASWSALITAFPQRGITDVQRMAIPGGFVQRHLFSARDSRGTERAWPTCIFTTIEGGLMTRLDEYLDRAGLIGAIKSTPGSPRFVR